MHHRNPLRIIFPQLRKSRPVSTVDERNCSLDGNSSFLLPFAVVLFVLAFASRAWTQEPTTTQAYAELPDSPQAQTYSAAKSEHSDSNAASIRGIVTDIAGAVYEGVQVGLSQPGSPERNTTTDSDGRFVFYSAVAGQFQITASSNGFATQTIKGTLHSGEAFETSAIVLPFARTTSEVEVTASRAEIATEELHMEEQQRVFGLIPNFYVVYAPNAPPLSARQKFHLAWRSSIDPVTFLATGAVAGIQQAQNEFRGYGQGAEGYGKRYAANYADGIIGDMLGGAVLPSIFKQDPRYFYNGQGTVRHRILYAIANSVICKGDDGRWQFNYSGIGGSLIAGGVSNLYYPKDEQNGVALTFENTGYGIIGSAVGNLFQEFLVRKLTPHVPNYNTAKP